VRGLLVLAGALLVLVGCGGSDDEPAGATGPAAPAPTVTATAPAGPPEQVVTVPEQEPPPATVTAPAPTPTSPEDAPGGAGDEEGIRVPARFVLEGGRLVPASLRVPAFLNIAVTVENRDASAHRLEVGDRGAQLPAGRTITLSLPGRAATDLPVLVDGTRAAVLRIAAETP
jgi:hypothetical protein